jgi:hypothetical protein
MVQCMFIARWIPKATNTHSEYVILVFFMATVVTWTCVSVTFYVHRLSCYCIILALLLGYGMLIHDSKHW